MTNSNTLENFRTKKELINYFEENGQSITKEEIETLKQSYKQIEADSNTLNLQQLDDVVGGVKGKLAIAWQIKNDFNTNRVSLVDLLKKLPVELQGGVLSYLSQDKSFMLSLKIEDINPLLENFILPCNDFIEALDPNLQKVFENSQNINITSQRSRIGRIQRLSKYIEKLKLPSDSDL